MARDSERYKVFNVAILRDSWVLEEIEKDAAEHQMPGHVNKLLALRLTEYYRLMKEGKISAALVGSRDGVGATNGNTATAEQTALPSVHESTARNAGRGSVGLSNHANNNADAALDFFEPLE
jgi:hypothetical protein